MSRIRRRTWIALFILAAIAVVIFTARDLMTFSNSEDAITAYCRTVTAGDSVKEARKAARAAGLVVRDVAATQSASQFLFVGSGRKSRLSGSICKLGHDGDNIVSATHDPWYH